MLLRCAFCCWDMSGALSSGSDPSDPRTRHEADPDTLFEASCMGTVDSDSRDPSAVRDAAYHYCIEGMLTPDGRGADPVADIRFLIGLALDTPCPVSDSGSAPL